MNTQATTGTEMNIVLAGENQTGKTSYYSNINNIDINSINIDIINFFEISDKDKKISLPKIDAVFLFYDIKTYKKNDYWIEKINNMFPKIPIILIRSKVDDKFGLVPNKYSNILISEKKVLTKFDISNITNYNKLKPLIYVYNLIK